MRIIQISLVLMLCGFMAGCVHHADFVSEQLKTGMSKDEVQELLGAPDKVHRVHFQGHEMDYIVWEYGMVPDAPVWPEEGAGRVIAGFVTLGLSEVGVAHMKAEPHWVYFFDDQMAYFSKAFDCNKDPECTIVKTLVVEQ